MPSGLREASSDSSSFFCGDEREEQKNASLLGEEKRKAPENLSRTQPIFRPVFSTPRPFESHRYREWVSLLREIDDICRRRSKDNEVGGDEEGEEKKKEKEDRAYEEERERVLCSRDDLAETEERPQGTRERGCRSNCFETRRRGVSTLQEAGKGRRGAERKEGSPRGEERTCGRNVSRTMGGDEEERAEMTEGGGIIEKGRVGGERAGTTRELERRDEENEDRGVAGKRQQLSLTGQEEEEEREKSARRRKEKEEDRTHTRSVSLLLEVLGRKQSYLVQRQERMLSRVKALEVEITQGREREKKLERQLARYRRTAFKPAHVSPSSSVSLPSCPVSSFQELSLSV